MYKVTYTKQSGNRRTEATKTATFNNRANAVQTYKRLGWDADVKAAHITYLPSASRAPLPK